MRGKFFILAALSVALLAASANAAEILRLYDSRYLSDANYWDGGVVPGSVDVALFDGTTVPGGGTTAYSCKDVWIGGYKITDIAEDISFDYPTYLYGSGVDMSAATADVTFENLRCNGGFGPLTVASGRTLTAVDITSASGKSAYTIPISGGGTVLVNNKASATNARMMFDVSGSGTTIGGNGTWAPFWSNKPYGIQVGAGAYIAPGTAGVGTMTIDDTNGGATALVLADGSGFLFELGTGGTFASPSVDSDMLALVSMAAGDVALGGTSNIDFLGTGSAGVFKLFDTDLDDTTWSGLALSGQEIVGGLTFSNLAGAGTLIMGDGVNGDLGDIYLEVVPEPTSLALVALGGLALLIRKR